MWGFGVLAILVLLGAVVLTALRFIKPLDKIELGVAEIINGNIDYQFRPVGPDFEGLSNGLNVMLARLLGREEPNEDEPEEEQDETARWRSDQMLVEEVPGPSATPSPEANALGQESEPIYYARIFNEYVAALRSQGKPTKGITVQAFTAKLRLIEGGLKQKWKCRMVRFKVNAQGEHVTLRPIPINLERHAATSRRIASRRAGVTSTGAYVVGGVRVADRARHPLRRRLDLVRGRRVGVLCHPASVTCDLVHVVDRLIAGGVRPARLFGPEHGVRGEAQDMIGVDDDRDTRTGIPVTSLYGDTFESLTPTRGGAGRDRRADRRSAGRRQPLLHVRLDDGAGAGRGRARAASPCVVLDRPNPLGGVAIEGGTVQRGCESFVGLGAVPVRHGLTIGEMARLVVAGMPWGGRALRAAARLRSDGGADARLAARR